MLNSPLMPIILLGVLLVLFVWNRWRYDLVAVFGLLCAVLLGIVPVEEAFLGFGHPAVILVAAALIISAGLKTSGALQTILGILPVYGRPLWLQLLIVCSVVALLSGFINNVAAVALMIPFVISLAYKSKISPRLYLMPIAFASLLGGLMTLIGTPPNIIISTYRAQQKGYERFSMFDFTPVGVLLTLGGLILIVLTVRYFISVPDKEDEFDLISEPRDFLTELIANKDCKLIGYNVRELSEKYSEANVLGIKRGEHVRLVPSQFEKIQENDSIIIEAISETIEDLIGKEGFTLHTGESRAKSKENFTSPDVTVVEVIVPAGSAALGRSSKDLDIRWKYAVNVLGVARAGTRFHRRLQDVIFHVGDVILLHGSQENIARLMSDKDWVFMNVRDKLFKRKHAVITPIVLFAAALAGSYFGFFEITFGFVACAFLYVLLGYLQTKDLYHSVEWPIIVLLACLIPVGEGMESSGSLLIVTDIMEKFSAGMGPGAVLAMVMVITMVLTNVINNAAAAIVMAPVAVQLAKQMAVSSDALLMGVAVAASAAFLTPIGHQSNALVMEPGKYKFKEYFYLGFPLSLVTLAIGIPAIMYFWPLR